MKITIGSEFEVHRIIGIDTEEYNEQDGSRIFAQEGLDYLERVKDTKVANVLKDLGLGDKNIFGEDFKDEISVTDHLCVIQKRGEDGKYRDFLAVTFDDNTEMNRLEFGSIGVEGGISEHRKFLNKDNLSNIRTVVEQFPNIVAQLKPDLAGETHLSENGEFAFRFPKDSKILFTDKKFKSIKENVKDAGSLHATHTIDTRLTPKAQTNFLEFCKSSRKSILEMPNNMIGENYGNNQRSNYSPNPKIPPELVKECNDQNILYPMSNTLSGVEADRKIYGKVKEIIQREINKIPSEEKLSILIQALEKVSKTDEFLGKQIEKVGKIQQEKVQELETARKATLEKQKESKEVLFFDEGLKKAKTPPPKFLQRLQEQPIKQE